MTDSIINISTETTTVELTTIEPVVEFIIPSQTIVNGGAWGAIDGDINNQLDLIAELDLKEDISNKATDLTAPDNVKYPSTLAIANALSLIDQALIEINSVLLGKQDVITNSDEITEGSTHLFLTTAERAKLGNTSGINRGDQDLSNYPQNSDLANVAFSGDYSDLSGTPSFAGHHIQSNGNAVSDRGNLNFLGNITVTDNSGNNSTDISLDAYQLALDYTPENVDNKATNLSNPGNTTYPTTAAIADELSNYSPTNSFANIAFSGNYSDLSNKPTIPSSHTQLGDIGTNSHAQIDTALARLANTSNNNTGDQDLSGLLVKNNNLSDLGNVTVARTNLGLGNLAVENDAVTRINTLTDHVYIIGSSNIQITAPSTPVPDGLYPGGSSIKITALPSGNSGDVLTNNSGVIGASPLKTINGNSLLGSGNITITPITDHTGLTSIGTNTHAQIDTALARLANTSGTNTGDLVLGNSTNGLTLANQTLQLGLSSGNTTGALSSTDWTTFNNKGNISGTIAANQIAFASGDNVLTGSDLLKADVYSSGGFDYPRIIMSGSINTAFTSKIQMIKDPVQNVPVLNIDSGSQIAYYTGYVHQFQSQQVVIKPSTYLSIGSYWLTGQITPLGWMESYINYTYRGYTLHNSGSTSAFLNFSVNSSSGTEKTHIYITSSGVRMGGAGSALAQLEILGRDSALPVQILKGASGQATDILQAQSSSGVSLFRFTNTGGLVLSAGGTAAGTAPLKLTTQAVGLTTVEQGAIELIGNSFQMTQLAQRRGVAMSQGVLTSDVTVGNSTTESAAVITSSHGANYLEVGKCEEIVLRGIIQQTSVGGGQLQVRIKYAGTTIQTIQTNTGNITANTPFEIRVSTTCRSTGVSGSLQLNSVLWIDSTSNVPDSSSLVTVNTTTANTVTITLQWTVANASNTITVNQGRVLCIEPSK